jgi:hypothetical protein
MMMSREASRLAGDFGTSVPNVSRHLLFTFGGQALGASGRPPWPPAAARPVARRRCAHFAALPAKAGSVTVGQRRPVWKEP